MTLIFLILIPYKTHLVGNLMIKTLISFFECLVNFREYRILSKDKSTKEEKVYTLRKYLIIEDN